MYEKDYEQYVKHDASLEDTDIKNRFEIRLKNDRAYHAVVDLMTYEDAGRTAFSIINRYIRFVDKDEEKRRSSWKMNKERSEEHTSELQSRGHLVCRLLLEKKNKT